METSNTLPISDLHQLAVLAYSRIQPIGTEYRNGRFWAFYDPKLAQEVLDQFEANQLQVDALTFCGAIQRVKDRIFERERAQRAKNGNSYAPIR